MTLLGNALAEILCAYAFEAFGSEILHGPHIFCGEDILYPLPLSKGGIAPRGILFLIKCPRDSNWNIKIIERWKAGGLSRSASKKLLQRTISTKETATKLKMVRLYDLTATRSKDFPFAVMYPLSVFSDLFLLQKASRIMGAMIKKAQNDASTFPNNTPTPRVAPKVSSPEYNTRFWSASSLKEGFTWYFMSGLVSSACYSYSTILAETQES